MQEKRLARPPSPLASVARPSSGRLTAGPGRQQLHVVPGADAGVGGQDVARGLHLLAGGLGVVLVVEEEQVVDHLGAGGSVLGHPGDARGLSGSAWGSAWQDSTGHPAGGHAALPRRRAWSALPFLDLRQVADAGLVEGLDVYVVMAWAEEEDKLCRK